MDVPTILSALAAGVPGVVVEAGAATDHPTLVVSRDHLIDTCRFLRDGPGLGFNVLVDVTAVDWWPNEPRFEVVYHLVATEAPHRLRLKVRLSDHDAHVPTTREIWRSANWLEREVYDLFGIVFDGHGDLRRLLMPEEWDGYPLRKDYPVQIKMKPTVYAPLQLTEQEFKDQIQDDRHVRGGSGRERTGRR